MQYFNDTNKPMKWHTGTNIQIQKKYPNGIPPQSLISFSTDPDTTFIKQWEYDDMFILMIKDKTWKVEDLEEVMDLTENETN